MKTFFQRFMQVIESQGYKNVNDFALNGLKYSSPSKLNRLKDDNNKPSFEILLDIGINFENINLDWLITGRGSMLKEEAEKPTAKDTSASDRLYLENYNFLIGELKKKEAIIEKLLKEDKGEG